MSKVGATHLDLHLRVWSVRQCREEADHHIRVSKSALSRRVKCCLCRVLNKMQTTGFETQNAILVTREPLTPMAMQTLKLLTDSKYHVEPFQEHELLIDITEHELVGLHYTHLSAHVGPSPTTHRTRGCSQAAHTKSFLMV